MNIRRKAALAMAFVVIELSFWAILLKVGGSSIGMIPQLFYGFLVGSIISFAVSIAIDHGRGLVAILKDRRVLLIIVIMGLLNNVLTQFFLGTGTLGTNPSIGAVVYRSYVILVALLAPLVIRQRVKKMQLLASVVGFLGVYIILSGGTLISFNPATTPYMGLLLLAAVCTAMSALFMNKYSFNIFGAIVIFNLSSLVFTGLLAMATHTSLSVAFTPNSLIAILFLGAFAYGIGASLVYYSIKVFGPLLFGNVILIVPFLAILLAALIANTPIMAYYLIAAVLMSVGVILQRRYSATPERKTSNNILDNMRVYDVTSAFVDNANPEMTPYIAGNKRALAIKLERFKFDRPSHEKMFSDAGCIAFTNYDPYEHVRKEEIAIVNEMIGVNDGEATLISLGEPKALENALAKFVKLQQ